MNRVAITSAMDQTIRDIFGDAVTQACVWWDKSDLSSSASWSYRVSALDIVVWRDRGSYSIFVGTTAAERVWSLAIVGAKLGTGCKVDGSVESPSELKQDLKFIKDNTPSIISLLAQLPAQLRHEGLTYSALPNPNHGVEDTIAQQGGGEERR